GENLALLAQVLDCLPDGLAVFDAERRLVVDNRPFRDLGEVADGGALRGHRPEELSPRAGWLAAVGGEESLRYGLEGGRIIEAECLPLPEGWSLVRLLDVTTIERARAALEATRQKSDAILETMIDGVVVFDEKGVVERVNAAAEAMFGRGRDDLLGRTLATLFDPNETDLAARLARPDELVGTTIEGTGRASDGKGFAAQLGIGALGADWRIADRRSRPRRSFVATIRDVSRQKEVDRQLRQAQKMEAVATLSGGIAHDFNNLLAVVLGYASLIALDVPDDAKDLRDGLATIETAARRGKDLIRQLLAFSRGGGEAREPLDLAPLAKEVAKLARATLPPGVTLRLALPGGPATVLANATQMHQVLLNLCTNAVQAIGSGAGRIDLALDVTDRDLDGARIVRLVVADTGPGIDPALADRIFDPFFTTKPVGQGTGLGLAVVQGIIRDHGGTIRVESALGQGARFEIELPYRDEAPPAQGGAARPDGRGRESILLVDGDAAIRRITARTLERLGYRVISAASGAEALDMLRRERQAAALIVADYALPDVTGEGLAAALRDLGLHQKIVLTTGGRLVDTATAVHLGIAEQVLKPSIVDDLGPAIRRALDEA
ncbi:MAG: response regulator, partial [Alphaproteobacteria bacterium]|nr:response regulator [Alphaproteobacteria bacterium]